MKSVLTNAWRDAYSIEILIDGEQYFPALLHACEMAKTHIHLSLYWFESGNIADQFIRIMLQARKKGIAVTCLLDEIGSLALSIADRRLLEDAGVLLGWFNPIRFERLHLILQRDHSKLFIIDNHTLFIGGTGIADIFLPKKTTDTQTHQQTPRVHWRENMFKLQGPIVIDALQSIQTKWSHKSVMLTNTPNWIAKASDLFRYNQSTALNATFGPHIQTKWIESKGRDQRKILKTIIQDMNRSTEKVILATAYFAPDPRLRLALKRAVKRGIQVIILLPGTCSDHPLLQRAGQYYYQKLLEAGVKIYEYEPAFMHAKIIICDDTVYFGSSNLDLYTQRWSLEANIQVKDACFTAEIAAVLAKDIAQSKEIALANWQKRHWWLKLTSFFAYKLGCWGDFLARQLLLMQKLRKP